ncbi:MAG: DNA-directed RNA polymerase subunit omega [Ruminococcaceae bacterium]|jgi:DNA-directed RNA polymerase subunit K/omega|nr:DNA-directed RNA polymerase subunit omega [Oscillospiraceae bacterium]
MIIPDMEKHIGNDGSAFALVVAIAKRSRDILEKANENKVKLPDKPINIAIEELCNNKIQLARR